MGYLIHTPFPHIFPLTQKAKPRTTETMVLGDLLDRAAWTSVLRYLGQTTRHRAAMIRRALAVSASTGAALQLPGG